MSAHQPPPFRWNRNVTLRPESETETRAVYELSPVSIVRWAQCPRCRTRFWYVLHSETPQEEIWYHGMAIRRRLLAEPCEAHGDTGKAGAAERSPPGDQLAGQPRGPLGPPRSAPARVGPQERAPLVAAWSANPPPASQLGGSTQERGGAAPAGPQGRGGPRSPGAAVKGVRVEFFGVARLSAGEKATVLPYEAAASLADVVGTLAVRYPALVGPVIAAGGRSLLDGYVFNLNGRDFVPDLGTKLHPGDTVLLVAAAAGG